MPSFERFSVCGTSCYVIAYWQQVSWLAPTASSEPGIEGKGRLQVTRSQLGLDSETKGAEVKIKKFGKISVCGKLVWQTQTKRTKRISFELFNRGHLAALLALETLPHGHCNPGTSWDLRSTQTFNEMIGNLGSAWIFWSFFEKVDGWLKIVEIYVYIHITSYSIMCMCHTSSFHFISQDFSGTSLSIPIPGPHSLGVHQLHAFAIRLATQSAHREDLQSVLFEGQAVGGWDSPLAGHGLKDSTRDCCPYCPRTTKKSTESNAARKRANLAFLLGKVNLPPQTPNRGTVPSCTAFQCIVPCPP